MNAKKSKALRRECLGIPVMKQEVPYPIYEWIRNQITKRLELKQIGNKMVKIRVSHYRNAKKLFKGSVPRAVRAAIRQAEVMESIGVYKYK